MPKETKERLTRARICSDLRRALKREMIRGILFHAVWVILFAEFALIFNAVLDVMWMWVLPILPLPFLVIAIVCGCRRSRMIEQCEYTVIEDRLDELSEGESDRALTGIIYGRLFPTLARVNAFYFASSGRYVAEWWDRDLFDLSVIDDPFYVVLYNDRNKLPVAVYNAKIYEWKEG